MVLCDNGGGIPHDIITRIFDPYYTTKDEINGTGLGLYMSKMMVEEHHNGKLTVENMKDGVCFTLHFWHESET
jgi:signal transduction histidine kinase